MGETPPADKWGTPSPDPDQSFKPLQTVQSKFLDAVQKYAEGRYLELVVVHETPYSGYGYIQKKNGFSNLYSFHFDFGSESATFYLGTEKLATALPEQKRVVDFSGDQVEAVLAEIKQKIDGASRGIFPELGALASKPAPQPGAPLNSLKAATPAPDPKATKESAAKVWGQDDQSTKSDLKSTYRRGSKLPGIIAIVAIIVIVFLVFVPIIQTNGEVGTCPSNSASCANLYPASYYASVTKSYTPLGGEYFPANQGWNTHAFVVTGISVNGGRVYGFAVWQYYFVI